VIRHDLGSFSPFSRRGLFAWVALLAGPILSGREEVLIRGKAEAFILFSPHLFP